MPREEARGQRSRPSPRLLRLAILAALPAIAIGAMLAAGNLTSRAVQNPSISLDMIPAGNIYCDSTRTDHLGNPCSPSNSMTVGNIDNCLTSAVANTVTHQHVVHLIIQNVEDLVGWQARVNYIGDKMRIANFNAAPFTDTFTGNMVGFANLPIDAGSLGHRDFDSTSSLPPAPPDGTNTHQTGRFGGIYNGGLTFAVSPDTPPKTVPDDSSYSAPSGGILASITLQVMGNEQGKQLFMNLDDGSPNSPGSEVTVFTGTGLTEIPISVTQLGAGFHGEGMTCAPQDCTSTECPSVDSDGDGWSDAAEAVIGTDPFDACADNIADDAWPADISNDTFVDTGDIGAVTNRFGQAVPPAPARTNVAPDPPNGLVDTADIGRITGLFGGSCPGS